MAFQADIEALLPLTEPTFFVMLSLVPEPKHGYAIMKDVRRLSQDRVVLSTGTLYGALKRLLEQGWIERADTPERAAVSTNTPRRPRQAYALTRLGQRVLDAEIGRLNMLVAVARLRPAGDPA